MYSELGSLIELDPVDENKSTGKGRKKGEVPLRKEEQKEKKLKLYPAGERCRTCSKILYPSHPYDICNRCIGLGVEPHPRKPIDKKDSILTQKGGEKR